MPRVRVIIGGMPSVEIEKRDVADRDYTYRAWIKGRSCGGFLTGYGSTEVAAAKDLASKYANEKEAVEDAIEELKKAARRRSRSATTV